MILFYEIDGFITFLLILSNNKLKKMKIKRVYLIFAMTFYFESIRKVLSKKALNKQNLIKTLINNEKNINIFAIN